MVFKDSVYFFANKSNLTVSLSFFREKKLHIFPKTFVVTNPICIKAFEIFSFLFFGKSATVILLFFVLMDPEFFSWIILTPSMTISRYLSLNF